MALTPEDVLNKHFTATQFRRGYDEQEVDDFLDEVVVELRRLTGENSELRRHASAAVGAEAQGGTSVFGGGFESDLAASQEAMEESQARAARAEVEARERIAAAVAEAERAERESQERIEAARRRAEETEQEAQRVEVAPAPERAEPAAVASAPADAAGVIALAQKVHDEYVEQGRQEHDRLVTEGTTRRDELVAEATARHAELLETGQARHDELVSTGEARHAELVAAAQSQHDDLLRTGQAEHDRLVTTGRSTADELVSDAETRREQVLGELERRRSVYDVKIGELATYEEAYRTSLTTFIRTHLDRLSAEGEVKPGALPDASVADLAGEGMGEDEAGDGERREDGHDAMPEEREVMAGEQA